MKDKTNETGEKRASRTSPWELDVAPPPEQWDDWVDLDPNAYLAALPVEARLAWSHITTAHAAQQVALVSGARTGGTGACGVALDPRGKGH